MKRVKLYLETILSSYNTIILIYSIIHNYNASSTLFEGFFMGERSILWRGKAKMMLGPFTLVTFNIYNAYNVLNMYIQILLCFRITRKYWINVFLKYYLHTNNEENLRKITPQISQIAWGKLPQPRSSKLRRPWTIELVTKTPCL